jgi:hypothetical protein
LEEDKISELATWNYDLGGRVGKSQIFNILDDEVLYRVRLSKVYLYVQILKRAFIWGRGGVVAMIVWYLDLQLPVQSVPITTKVVSLNPADDEV